MNNKQKIIVSVVFSIMLISMSYLLYSWTQQTENDTKQSSITANMATTIEKEISSEMINQSDNLENSQGTTDAKTIDEIKNSIPIMIERVFNYLSSDDSDSINRYYRGVQDDRPDMIPVRYETQDLFEDDTLGYDFALSLNLTTPSGKLHFGELALANDTIIYTAKPGDIYMLTEELSVTDITNRYPEGTAYAILELEIKYQAGVSLAYRKYHLDYNSSGKMTRFYVADMDTLHQEKTKNEKEYKVKDEDQS